MEDNGERDQDTKKIQLGRLHIDPIFLLLMLFSLFSVFLLGFFVWWAS